MDEALDDGDVDAAVYDNTVVGDVVSRNPTFEVAAEFDTGEQYGMAVKKNGNIDLLRSINNVLADLKTDGGYDEIYGSGSGTPRRPKTRAWQRLARAEPPAAQGWAW